ncbi:hypothetical protein XH93_26330 [Bradyrhizobium sp. CCBAU 51753]|nr:hypothetical protein XH93_26330 [Bradyrhizobium sp. CCBAU 51753]
MTEMDDYRDLMTASLALVCAGIMLLAGQLYIEHHPVQDSQRVHSQPQPPALVSHAPSSHENTAGPRQGIEKDSTS